MQRYRHAEKVSSAENSKYRSTQKTKQCTHLSQKAPFSGNYLHLLLSAGYQRRNERNEKRNLDSVVDMLQGANGVKGDTFHTAEQAQSAQWTERLRVITFHSMKTDACWLNEHVPRYQLVPILPSQSMKARYRSESSIQGWFAVAQVGRSIIALVLRDLR